MVMLGAFFLGVAIIAALFGFGVLRSPYIGTFRIVFYFFLFFFLATLVVGIMQQQSDEGGYNPTTQVR
jgi:uncharacterized membrane protein YtjA (UPF0391 family)